MAERDGVRASTAGGILTLVMSRPDKGNALRQRDTESLADEVEAVSTRDDVRAVLLRSEGRTFCAGADLHTANAVQGPALGLGLHLAVVCDFVLVAPEATFAEPFCKRGFSADSGGSFLLPKLIGFRRARQMLIRGVTVDADTAADWGLVDEVVPSASLSEAASALVAELAAGPTFSLGHTKDLLSRRAPGDLTSALRAEAASVEATLRSADFKEGIRAFLERRAPVFTGN